MDGLILANFFFFKKLSKKKFDSLQIELFKKKSLTITFNNLEAKYKTTKTSNLEKLTISM